MLFSVIIFCVLLVFIEMLTLYKSKKINELKIYLTISAMLAAITLLEYIELIPRHFIKNLSTLFNLF